MKTKNKILPEQEEEKTFQYRTYGKGELALLYLHNIHAADTTLPHK